jgi:hypothetical protein
MDLWSVVADATTTTITTATRVVTTTTTAQTTTVPAGIDDAGQGLWTSTDLWISLIAAIPAAIIAAVLGSTLSYLFSQRAERQKAEAERRAVVAAEHEAAREARRARVTIAYAPPAPGSNRFGSLDLINEGPSLARNATWRVEENPGGPVVFTEAQVSGDPHHIKELPPMTRLPVGWVARPVGRSEALSIVLTWKDGEGYNERRVTVLVPP